MQTITGERMPKCLVTGGAGAIGSRLVQRLLHLGASSVVVVDDLSSGYEWLLPSDSRVRFVNRDVVSFFVEEPDECPVYVFHLAAFFANQNSVDHPMDDLRTNGGGTLSVLQWAADSDVKRIIYASAGCSIAGHGLDVPISEDMPVSLHLDTPYQITKALGEFYCNYYLEQVSNVRCRFFNSYGPGEVPGPYRNVIPNFIWLAMHNMPLTITGTGDETRDFIYVDDLVEGLVRCAIIDQAHGLAINLGTGHQTTIRELADSVIRLTNSSSEILYSPRRVWDKSTSREADNSRARNVLSLNTATKLEEGLRNTIDWFRQHYESIAPSCKF